MYQIDGIGCLIDLHPFLKNWQNLLFILFTVWLIIKHCGDFVQYFSVSSIFGLPVVENVVELHSKFLSLWLQVVSLVGNVDEAGSHSWHKWDGFISFLLLQSVMILMWTVMLQNSKNLTFQMHYKLCWKSWKIALQKQRLLLSEMYLFLFHILFRETISHSLKIINCCFHKFSLRCSGATENKPLFPVNWI